jgi:hypothetical protein
MAYWATGLLDVLDDAAANRTRRTNLSRNTSVRDELAVVILTHFIFSLI